MIDTLKDPHVWVPLAGTFLFCFFLAFDREIEDKIFSLTRCMSRGIKRQWSRRARRLVSKLPRLPHRMQIVRHPDGQRETLPFFKKE